jgi:nucleoside phosphorylase
VRPDVLVSTGFCGALDPALKAGEVFVATEVESLGETQMVEARLPQCSAAAATGRLISVNRVVQTAEEKATLRAGGASVVEMEAAAVGLRAKKWGVPFYCVRAVTDLAHETFELDFNAARADDGRISTALILRAALRRPNPIASELYRLSQRSRLAAKSLGEYFADCQF